MKRWRKDQKLEVVSTNSFSKDLLSLYDETIRYSGHL